MYYSSVVQCVVSSRSLCASYYVNKAEPETSALLVHKSPVHGLIACGGEDGFLECFDQRQKASVGRILAVGAGNEDQVRDNPTDYSAWHEVAGMFSLWHYWLFDRR